MRLRTRVALRIAGNDLYELVALILMDKERALADLAEQKRVDELESSRLALQLLEKFLETLDDPDNWEREVEALREARIDLRDQVARLEEHSCTYPSS